MDINAKCIEILESCGQPQQVIDHCRAVAEVSRALALALNAKGLALDDELCWRGGLLHDVRRTERFHAIKGMLHVMEAGLRDEARIVGAHMGDFIDTDRVAEKEVVYIADKITKGTGRVSVAERYARSLEKFTGDEAAVRAAHERREQSMKLAAYIEGILGRELHRFDA